MSDQYAAGMRRAAEIVAAMASDHADMVLTGLPENARNREAMEAALTKARYAILAAIPAPAPWTPPEDRPDGFECLGWRREGEWEPVKWLAYMDRWWWIFTDNATGQPTAFAPLPPAPAQGDAP